MRWATLLVTASPLLAGAFSTAGALSSAGALSAPWGSIAAAPALPLPRVAIGGDSARLASTLATFLRSRLEADDAMLAMVSPGAYWLLRDWRRRTFGTLPFTRRALEGAKREVHRLGREHSVLRGATVSVRTKGLWSTFCKAVVRQRPVYDVLAVRVVLRKGLDADACFEAHAALRSLWSSQPKRFKDHVSSPKKNGYQALHDTMVLPSSHRFEVQIRTDAMHRIAEYGSAAHRRYKGALATLPLAVLSGVAVPWPVQPHAALSLAARLADA